MFDYETNSHASNPERDKFKARLLAAGITALVLSIAGNLSSSYPQDAASMSSEERDEFGFVAEQTFEHTDTLTTAATALAIVAWIVFALIFFRGMKHFSRRQVTKYVGAVAAILTFQLFLINTSAYVNLGRWIGYALVASYLAFCVIGFLTRSILNNVSFPEDLLDAAESGSALRIESLLNSGLDVNYTTPDGSGDTALMIAASRSHLRAVKTLLDRGALVEIGNDLGFSALDLAEANNAREVAELIRRFKTIGRTEDSTSNVPLPTSENSLPRSSSTGRSSSQRSRGIVVCPSCRTKVLATADNRCPACKARV